MASISEEFTTRPATGLFSWPGRLAAWLEQDTTRIWMTILTFAGTFGGLALSSLAPSWAVLAYIIAYVAGGYYGAVAGLQALRAWRIDVDVLMVLAALGAALVGSPFEGALLLFLFSLSNVLQQYALDRTRHAIRQLMQLRPDTALVKEDGTFREMPLDQIAVGQIIVVRPGERIGLDGVVVKGESAINQAALTGESMPVEKGVGDEVLAGSINETGSLEIRVSRPEKDSTLSRLIKLVEQAQADKAQTERFIDRAEQYYALGVIVLTAALIIVPWLLLGRPFEPVFYRAMTLMVAASPCALVISTPATVLSAIGNGARRGILFKGGMYVERAALLKVIAFDKTGTLTVGRPEVTDVRPLDAEPAGQILRLAAAVEALSEHPLAQAIVRAAGETRLPEAHGFQSTTGMGVTAEVDGRRIAVGNRRYLGLASDVADEVMAELQNAGKTAVLVADLTTEPRLLGVIALADVLRPQAAAVIKRLKQRGIVRTVMLTGDNPRVAAAIGRQVGIDEIHAGLMPEDKLRLLKRLSQQYGPVGMVGDGVNDAPALAAADIGIAMGAAGSDVALETADIVLMSDDLTRLPYVIGLSRQTRRTLFINLAFALLVIAFLITSVLGFGLSLPLSVVGHEGSTVIVSLNGLRMLAYNEP